MANGGVTSTTGPTTAGHPPYPWGSLASLCSSACGTPTQAPLVEPKWGGGVKRGPTRAQSQRIFYEDAGGHAPPGGRCASCQVGPGGELQARHSVPTLKCGKSARTGWLRSPAKHAPWTIRAMMPAIVLARTGGVISCRLSSGRKVLAPVVSLEGHDVAYSRRSLELN